jgi:hypothetical protein
MAIIRITVLAGRLAGVWTVGEKFSNEGDAVVTEITKTQTGSHKIRISAGGSLTIPANIGVIAEEG